MSYDHMISRSLDLALIFLEVITRANLVPENPSLSTPPPIQDLLQQKVPPVAALGPVRLRVRLPGLLARRPRPREGRLVPHRDRQARTEVCSGENPIPRTTLQIFFFWVKRGKWPEVEYTLQKSRPRLLSQGLRVYPKWFPFPRAT